MLRLPPFLEIGPNPLQRLKPPRGLVISAVATTIIAVGLKMVGSLLGWSAAPGAAEIEMVGSPGAMVGSLRWMVGTAGWMVGWIGNILLFWGAASFVGHYHAMLMRRVAVAYDWARDCVLERRGD